MTIAIKNPIAPMRRIPIAETFATDSNSFFDGFLSKCHTRLHFIKNDFEFVMIVML